MSTKIGRPSRQRLPLSRERVLRAGIELADEEGIEQLSMRRLAQPLGVEAMSLYHHVANKDDLLAGMLDIVFAEMELPSEEGDWKAALRRTAISAHHVLLRHEWACGLLMQPTGPSAARLRWMNSVLRRLRHAGFSADMTHHSYHALDSHIVGFTLWVLPYLKVAREQPGLVQDFISRVSVDDLPYLAEHIGVHMSDRPGETSEFDFGLDLILDGLERELRG
ncbi:MAG TPA: TetR/AcrR family transcriptional regulator C-terminal domain-containing protein [Candidatus Limnocylindria bacterium]|nr:TetR/AcrR family transcriptional regulator C-terminal domain-containing protein [Candidatus Limnocylindria bacterium]